MLETLDQTPLSFEQIDSEVAEFEATERRRLGLDETPASQWLDANPREFTRSQRPETTILIGGLTVAQDHLIKAALNGIGYRIEVLDCPDNQALNIGKEFGNRGQCNPTYFTVGNLVKRLMQMRDVEHIPVQEIIDRYLFLTAGACGPCRFGTYVTEYRKALRDAGFEGFRVLLFQQMGGLKQATGDESGLQLNSLFFRQVLKAIMCGDVLNALGYRIRPYEMEPGATDAAIEQSKQLLQRAFENRGSIVLELRRCRRYFSGIKIDRLNPKPKVMIIGEFWAMTTEGAGNYHLQRFLESEGAEVDVQLVTAWVLYMLWQVRFDTRRRMKLRKADGTRRGLRDKSPTFRLLRVWGAERALRTQFSAFAWAIGLNDYHLCDMDTIAALAQDHYNVELRGGEGHMEVGKLVYAIQQQKANMVVSVKPFGCMPSSGVSDGVQPSVLKRFPQAIFCPVETTGDGAVNFQSRVLMFLHKARKQAKSELDTALGQLQLTAEQFPERLRGEYASPCKYPPHVVASTAANLVYSSR